MAVVAVSIKLTSKGPVLFQQKRCGRNGEEFELLKFRSMRHSRYEAGEALTAQGDRRVTSTGRILRRWKLDELPQLFNVLRGDMSLVGPRPDLAEYLNRLSTAQRHVLRLKPGMTGSATLHLRHEEDLLSTIPSEQLRDFYITTLLPQKVQMDLDYAAGASFASDTAILLYTVAAILH
jgi:lipopolysaccharide/colanic/teichoic acid biosynthesis glycosyltransferase